MPSLARRYIGSQVTSCAVDGDRAGVRRHQPGDGVEAGGLAGAVRAEQRRHLAAAQRQRHVAQHRPACGSSWRGCCTTSPGPPSVTRRSGPRSDHALGCSGTKIVCTRPSEQAGAGVEVDAQRVARQRVGALGQEHVAVHLDDAGRDLVGRPLRLRRLGRRWSASRCRSPPCARPRRRRCPPASSVEHLEPVRRQPQRALADLDRAGEDRGARRLVERRARPR